jgi:predicted amidohydrolase
MIISPWGDIINKSLALNADVIYANINLDKVYEIRNQIPVIQSQLIIMTPTI